MESAATQPFWIQAALAIFVLFYLGAQWIYVWREHRGHRSWFLKLGLFAAANFALFLATAILIGGDALSGYLKDGRYFVSSGPGKPIHEVSRLVWNISYIQGVIMFASSAAVAVVGIGRFFAGIERV